MPFIRDAGLDMTAVRALGELCSYSAVEAGKEVFAQAYICHAGSCAYHVHTRCACRAYAMHTGQRACAIKFIRRYVGQPKS